MQYKDTSPFSFDEEEKFHDSKRRLAVAVVHKGDSLHGGHLIALVYQPASRTYSKFDDGFETEGLSYRDVAIACGSRRSRQVPHDSIGNVTLLIYVKVRLRVLLLCPVFAHVLVGASGEQRIFCSQSITSQSITSRLATGVVFSSVWSFRSWASCHPNVFQAAKRALPRKSRLKTQKAKKKKIDDHDDYHDDDDDDEDADDDALSPGGMSSSRSPLRSPPKGPAPSGPKRQRVTRVGTRVTRCVRPFVPANCAARILFYKGEHVCLNFVNQFA